MNPGILRKYLRESVDLCYSYFGNLDVVSIAKKRSIKVDYIIEAGCHDGSDSVLLSNAFKPLRYLAFEPDEVARSKAALLFQMLNLQKIELSPLGLSNINGVAFLNYEASGKGSGSTHISSSGQDSVKICKFDDHFQVKEKAGLLWLDVEGHALQALEGMRGILSSIVIARIEVQLHTRRDGFEQDFKEVIRIMKRYSLVPIYGPIHPSHFGDIIFALDSLLPFKDKVRSKCLMVSLNALHLFLYPLLHKPSRDTNLI